MFKRDKKRQTKQSRYPTVDNYADCAFCGNRFNYRYQGTITLAGEEFCNDECARENYLKSVRERDEPIPFDAL